MKKGDRVSFDGRVGTVVGFMPAGMVDIRFDDAAGRVERRSQDRLGVVAKPNGVRGRRPRRARRNGDDWRDQVPVADALGLKDVGFSGKDETFLAYLDSLPVKQAVGYLHRLHQSRYGGSGHVHAGVVGSDAAYERFHQARAMGVDQSTLGASARRTSEALRQAGIKMRQTTRPEQKRLDQDVQQKLHNRGAAMFTRADPPRLGGDGQTYCGNPIDGTAYYVVVDQARTTLTQWLTKAEVAREAREDKVDVTDVAAVRAWLKATYIPWLESQRGVRVVAEPEGVQKYIKLRGGKRGAASQSKILRAELLEKRQRKPERAPAEADPNINFSLPHPSSGRPVYFRVYRSKTAAFDKLRRFSPFIYRQFSAPDPDTLPEGTPWGALTLALVAASRQDNTIGTSGMSPQVADSLIQAGAVSINRSIETDPNSNYFEAGDDLTVSLRDKANSPFFSWTPTVVPISTTNHNLSPCLSGEDMQVRQDLQTMSRVLGKLNGSLRRVRSLFSRLSTQPSSLRLGKGRHDVQQEVMQLTNSYVRLVQWYSQMYDRATSGDAAAARVLGQTGDSRQANLHQFIQALGHKGVELFQELATDADYAKFMQNLRTRVLDTRTPGLVEAEVTVGVVGGDTRQELAQLARTPVPGKTALLYLEGQVTPLPHPMDDMFLYVQPSLHPAAYRKLLELRQSAAGRGIEEMRFVKSSGGSYRNWEKIVSTDPEVKAALKFRNLVGIYGQGGQATEEGMMDPMDRKFGFDLVRPPGWTTPVGQQVDANWAIGLVIDDVHPTLVWGAGVPPKTAAQASRDLLLLSNLYYLLDGYQLSGPLNPNTPERPTLLQSARASVNAAEAELLGGSLGLGSTGNYTAFKTYNPVLFELTRLFWPAGGARDSGPAWSNILQHADQLADLDAVGRYGFATAATQQVAARARSEEEVSIRLGHLLGPANGTEIDDLMQGLARDPASGRTVKAPQGLYAPFLLNWPLGMGLEGASQAAGLWATQPLEYIKMLKDVMQQAIPKMMQIRRVGMPGAKRPPVGDMPFLFSQPAIYPGDEERGIKGSALFEAEQMQNEQEIRTMVRELDKAIEKLDDRIRGKG